jgi:hypothetical protein
MNTRPFPDGLPILRKALFSLPSNTDFNEIVLVVRVNHVFNPSGAQLAYSVYSKAETVTPFSN